MTTALIISDIHANWPGLEAVLDDAPEHDKIFVPGDLVGTLGFNHEVVSWARENADRAVYGNHECRVRADYSRIATHEAWLQEQQIVTSQLDDDDAAYIADLPAIVERDEYVMAHSWPVRDESDNKSLHGFMSGDSGVSKGDVVEAASMVEQDIVIVGHTHWQFEQRVDKFTDQSGVVLNPGSVGVPWFEPADYAIIDLDTQDVELRSTEYDNSRVAERMRELGMDVSGGRGL